MNTDIRISVSFKGNRKRKKLQMLIGPGATGYLIDLWITVAMERPDGDLSGLDDTDIAIMAGWEGDPLTFLTALNDVKFITGTSGNYRIHDWCEHNGYASSASERSDKSRFSRMAKTHPSLYFDLKNQGFTSISSSDYRRLTTVERPLTNRLSPSPLPSPSIKDLKAAAAIDVVEDVDRQTENQPEATMPISECRKLYRDTFGTINENQPIITVLQDICGRYPPDRINEAFHAAAINGAKRLSWVCKRLEDAPRPAETIDTSAFRALLDEERRARYGAAGI